MQDKKKVTIRAFAMSMVLMLAGAGCLLLKYVYASMVFALGGIAMCFLAYKIIFRYIGKT